MQKHIILSTPSAYLRIQLNSESCAIDLSKDRKSLLIEQTEEKAIGEVELQLNNDLEHTTITTIHIPSRYNSSTQRIRIDSLFSLIFQENEEISYMEMKNLALFNFPADVNEFSLNITVHLGREILNPSIAVVRTESILVESRVVNVSKELLAISSEYFISFFYGNYRENERGMKSIKEISYDDFVRFIMLMHKRKFEIPSVDLCLIALGFADYFGFMAVVAKTVPYLLTNKLPEHLLNQGLELADKLPNNTEILEWVLKHIPNNDNFFQVLHDSLPIISHQTAQYCLKKLQEEQPKFQRFSDITSLEASLVRGQIGIELRRCQNSYVVDKKFFAIRNYHPKSYAMMSIAIDEIWAHVPNGVNRINCFGGPSFTRDDCCKTFTHLPFGNTKSLSFSYEVQSCNAHCCQYSPVGALRENRTSRTSPRPRAFDL